MSNYDYLGDMYDNLKNPGKVTTDMNDRPASSLRPPMIHHPNMVIKQSIGKNCEKHRDNLCGDVLTDIYSQVLPLDQDYKDNNKGMVAADIDVFLKDKDVSAYQYIKSAFEKTKSPLLEFVLNVINNKVNEYREEANAELEENPNEVKEVPHIDDAPEKTEEIKQDMEYQTFVDKLKKKTMDKIVHDISDIISDKKEENNMNFSINNNESTCMAECVGYLAEKTLKAGKDFAIDNDTLGLAIRECTLHELDVLFKFESPEVRLFSTKLNVGKGLLINESVVA